MTFLETQRKNYFLLLVHLVEYTTKQPLEPDKGINLFLITIMQQQDKNAGLLLHGRENCTILAAFAIVAKSGFSALPCLTGYDTDLTFARTGPNRKKKKQTQNFTYCLAEEECIRVIFLAVYQSLLKV